MLAHRKRVVWILGTGCLVILATLFYVHYFLRRPLGSGPAGPVVERSWFDTPWTDRRVKLLGIGDSVTAGLGARSRDHSYFNRVHQNPSDEFPEMEGISLKTVLPQITAENLAVSGSTSLDHWRVISERLPIQDPEVFGLVMLTTGGNDLIHSYGRMPPKEGAMYGATLTQAEPWIEAFGKRLGEMLDQITASFPGGCEIFLGDIYDPTDGVGDAPSIYLPRWPDGLAIHARYNDTIRRCASARQNVFTVPVHRTFLGHGSHCCQFWRVHYDASDPHYWYYDNIEDPNDRGYDALRRIFLNAIVENSKLLPKGGTR